MAKLFLSHLPSWSAEIPAKESLPPPYLEKGSPILASRVSFLCSRPAEKEIVSLNDFDRSIFSIIFEKAYPPGLNEVGLVPFTFK